MTDEKVLTDAERIHVVGIGGAGMSGLARLLAGRGHELTGSDAKPSALLDDLGSEGIVTWAGSQPDGIGRVDLVVASSAVPDSDSELIAALTLGIPVWRRPQLLAVLTSLVPTIGPTGTHGKTSTTAMLVAGARAAGVDPSFVVGGELVDLGTNAGSGSDDLLILEVDEAFGTFEHVRLEGLIVTNVESDHLDHFGSFQEIEAAFSRVAEAVEGPVFACVDDPGSARLVSSAGAIGYGTGENATWRITDLEPDPQGSRFRLDGPSGRWDVVVPRPGVHMARNAVGALALLDARGIEVDRALEGLARFGGVGRRWDERGTVRGVTVIDDYAHHPTEVAATLEAALASGRRVVAVFQPHLYSRTAAHANAFGAALARAAVSVVLPVYGAREAPVEGVDARLISDAARRAGALEVVDALDRASAAEVVSGIVAEGDLVVCMGAGDITDLPDELLSILGANS